MNLRKPLAVVAAAALGLTMAACSKVEDTPTTTDSAGPITLTVSGWSLSTTPEFQVLADAFSAKYPNITVTVKEYDAADYETLMLTDMTANQAPDIITIKQAKFTRQWSEGGQLLDISDIVKAQPSNVSGADSYVVDGKNYGSPYRQDSWLLFYNIDLFNKAGVALPDGSWTWDDYVTAAKELTSKLDGVKGTYEHSWQSTLQGFANSQSPTADLTGGKDYTYLKPYYERAIDLQNSGAQETYANITTNKITYQGTFGKQQSAMLPMGSWYVATILAQQASGDADKFAWGIAPVPQYDASTTGTKTPVTFGAPTAMGINAHIPAEKLDAAKAFVNFIATEEAGIALANIGISSSVSSDAVTNAYFAQNGIPTDDLSKFAIGTHNTKPENPPFDKISAIQTALNEAHTAIMSASDVSVIDAEIATATDKIKAELG